VVGPLAASTGIEVRAARRPGRKTQAMGIIRTIIIGLLAGIVAKYLMPGRDPGGLIITNLLGIAGAFVATYLGQAIGWYQVGEGAGFIGAVVGAIILLIVYRLIKGRRSA
jgi:uncharacterized membrane protein YeaQ/YmgE (transglycosylase-associated protein family)